MFGHYPHGSSFHSDLPQYQVHLHIQAYMLSLQRFPLLLSSLQTVVAIYFSYMEIFGEKPDMGAILKHVGQGTRISEALVTKPL